MFIKVLVQASWLLDKTSMLRLLDCILIATYAVNPLHRMHTGVDTTDYDTAAAIAN